MYKTQLSIFAKIAVFIALAYFPIFLHLDSLPIRIWDESRLVANAIEMHKNNNFIVTHYSGKPEMWSTKPPFLIWLQVVGIKCFGLTELAFRLPSALAAFFTCIALMFFSIKYLRDYWFGLIAVLVLVTSYGYINCHIARTADYDSMLTFFIAIYSLSFFSHLQFKSNKFLHIFFAALTFAVLTKGVQGLLFLPGLAIYFFIEKNYELLRNKWFYIDFLFFIFIVLGYYLLRENYNPGYINAVWENELGGRYLSTLEFHKAGPLFYYNMLVQQHFTTWYWLIPCSIFIGIFSKRNNVSKLTVFSTICILSYLVIISNAQTKLGWYEAPMFPFLAILAAISINFVYTFLVENSVVKHLLKVNILPVLFLYCVFVFPYENIIDSVYFPKEDCNDVEYYNLSCYLRNLAKSDRDCDNYSICHSGYSPQLLLYQTQLENRNQNVGFKNYKTLNSENNVIAAEPEVLKYIESNYSYEIVEQYKNVKCFKILGLKIYE